MVEILHKGYTTLCCNKSFVENCREQRVLTTWFSRIVYTSYAHIESTVQWYEFAAYRQINTHFSRIISEKIAGRMPYFYMPTSERNLRDSMPAHCARLRWMDIIIFFFLLRKGGVPGHCLTSATIMEFYFMYISFFCFTRGNAVVWHGVCLWLRSVCPSARENGTNGVMEAYEKWPSAFSFPAMVRPLVSLPLSECILIIFEVIKKK